MFVDPPPWCPPGWRTRRRGISPTSWLNLPDTVAVANSKRSDLAEIGLNDLLSGMEDRVGGEGEESGNREKWGMAGYVCGKE